MKFMVDLIGYNLQAEPGFDIIWTFARIFRSAQTATLGFDDITPVGAFPRSPWTCSTAPWSLIFNGGWWRAICIAIYEIIDSRRRRFLSSTFLTFLKTHFSIVIVYKSFTICTIIFTLCFAFVG